MRTRLLLAFLITLALAACVSCADTTVSAAPKTDTAAAPAQNSSASTATSSKPASLPADATFVTTAPIVVENQVDVTSQRDGVVVRILADTGRKVRKGELLAELDSRQLQADRAALEHQLRATEDDAKYHETEQNVNTADLTRAQKMFDAGLITREQFDHVQFVRDATVWQIDRERQNTEKMAAQVRSLDLEIQKTRIMAPFDGVVARRYVRAGQKVAPNDRLFWVTAVAPLRVRFTLPQEDVRAVRPGSTIQLEVPFAEDRPHTAKVVSVSPVVDPASGTIEVLAELVGSPGQLKPGMTANIRVPLATPDTQTTAHNGRP